MDVKGKVGSKGIEDIMRGNRSDVRVDCGNGRVECNFFEEWVSGEGWKGGKGNGRGREAGAEGNRVEG